MDILRSFRSPKFLGFFLDFESTKLAWTIRRAESAGEALLERNHTPIEKRGSGEHDPGDKSHYRTTRRALVGGHWFSTTRTGTASPSLGHGS